jgi:hypothetical protein
MASSKELAKRRAARVWRHFEKALDQMAVVREMFAEHHPEYAEAIDTIAMQVCIVQSEWEDFWRSAWGELPENIESYAD